MAAVSKAPTGAGSMSSMRAVAFCPPVCRVEDVSTALAPFGYALADLTEGEVNMGKTTRKVKP